MVKKTFIQPTKSLFGHNKKATYSYKKNTIAVQHVPQGMSTLRKVDLNPRDQTLEMRYANISNSNRLDANKEYFRSIALP